MRNAGRRIPHRGMMELVVDGETGLGVPRGIVQPSVKRWNGFSVMRSWRARWVVPVVHASRRTSRGRGGPTLCCGLRR